MSTVDQQPSLVYHTERPTWRIASRGSLCGSCTRLGLW